MCGACCQGTKYCLIIYVEMCDVFYRKFTTFVRCVYDFIEGQNFKIFFRILLCNMLLSSKDILNPAISAFVNNIFDNFLSKMIPMKNLIGGVTVEVKIFSFCDIRMVQWHIQSFFGQTSTYMSSFLIYHCLQEARLWLKFFLDIVLKVQNRI